VQKGSEPRSTAQATWSAEAFQRDAGPVVERVRKHLAQAIARDEGVTRGFPSPDELLRHIPGGFQDAPTSSLSDFVELAIQRSPWQHHPRYVGHQVSPAIPRAALLQLVAATLNNGMAAFESGPAISVMERRVIEWMTALVGWASGGGILTSGGSLGNLTALLAARQRKAGFDVRDDGLAAHQPLALLASDQVHYSIERAAQIMGLGRRAVIPVRTDDRFRLVPDDIPRAFEQANASGRRPIALIASAGATGTGSIDPLDPIADHCERLGLWLHVDGAHGASALLSPRHREALEGIERADSLTWDAHKLMSMPALSTAVLYKDARDAYETFAQDASYLFHGDPAGRWFDVGLRTVECTKPLMALPLYGCLATLGVGVFREALEWGYDLAREFAGMIEAAEDFELACAPESNIVCFRHLDGDAGEELDARQRFVVDRLREAGTFYTVKATLRGKVYLRTALMNPLTTREDLEALLEAIRVA